LANNLLDEEVDDDDDDDAGVFVVLLLELEHPTPLHWPLTLACPVTTNTSCLPEREEKDKDDEEAEEEAFS
jgi:hypothetical protein